jgi:anti-anti-sigma regulatory factor
VTIVSLTVSNETRRGVSVVKLGGAVEDDVLSSALDALRAMADDGGLLVIDLDELTICSRAPFEALIDGARATGHGSEVVLVCRRRSARRLLRALGIAKDLPVVDSVDAVLARRRREDRAAVSNMKSPSDHG